MFNSAKAHFSRWFPLVLLVMMCVSNSKAAVVSYMLSYNDDGSSGAPAPGSAPGSFAVYASDSPDNGGIFGLTVDLAGPIDSLANMLQGVSWIKSGAIPPRPKYTGFLAGFATDPVEFKVSGLQDLSKGSDLIPVYGLGQVSGDLYSLKPGATYVLAADINGNGTVYNSDLLVAVGTVQAGQSITSIRFDLTSGGNLANVFDDCTGTENLRATISIITPADGLGASSVLGSLSPASAVLPCAAIPEPATMSLLAIGALGLLPRWRRDP